MSSLTPRLDRLDKNYLINGDFEFWQRNTTFNATGFSADRWRAIVSGTGTISRNSSVVPDGSLYTARWTSGGGASFSLQQPLESVWANQLKGKTVTASVKIKRNSTYDANFSFAIEKNSTGDTATGGLWVSMVSATLVNASIPTSNYLTVSLTTTVPNDTSANGIKVVMSHSGSSIVGSILDMSQVTLTVGDGVPNEFCRAGRDFAEELQLCQRYYEKSYNVNVLVPTVTDEGRVVARTDNTGNFQITAVFKTRKRVNPSATTYSPATGAANVISIAGSPSGCGVTVGETNMRVVATGAANADGEFQWAADAEL